MRSLGNIYEQKACEYLVSKGYLITERNFCVRGGEIDIIARDGDTLVFVEVKARRSEKSGEPLEAVTEEKRRRLGKAAMFYMNKNSVETENIRFDAIGIKEGPRGLEIEHIENAFCPKGYFI
ncbi:MAG: YraN family protein [Elusimicrobiota bacterium]